MVIDVNCAQIRVRRISWTDCLVLGHREVAGALHCGNPWTVWRGTIDASGVVQVWDARYFADQRDALAAFTGEVMS